MSSRRSRRERESTTDGTGTEEASRTSSSSRSRRPKARKKNKGNLLSWLLAKITFRGGDRSDPKPKRRKRISKWRVDSSGAGLVRRKGEKNRSNWGFQVPDRALKQKVWAQAPDLPPKGANQAERDELVAEANERYKQNRRDRRRRRGSEEDARSTGSRGRARSWSRD